MNQFFSSPLFLGLVATAFTLYVVTLIHINLKFPKKKKTRNKKLLRIKENSKSVKTDICKGDQFLGFLRKHYPEHLDIPSNCKTCKKMSECLFGKPKKRGILKRIFSFGLILLFCTMVLSPSFVYADERDILIAETPLTVFGEHEWVHVNVGGEHAGSVAWEGYDKDVQLVFYAYSDSGLSFDQFVIEANISYSDPFSKFYVYWGGEISGEGKILFKFYSFLGQTTTLVEPFAGETPHYGRPGTRVKKSVITGENEIFDVFGANNVHLCSFEWSFVSVSNNITNMTQSIPSLIVYNPDGIKYDTKVLSATMLPLVEFFDRVGFMVDSMGTDYVKWILYSDQSLRVAMNQGFEDKSLPSFHVRPISLRVEPNQLVTVSFVLPEGITEYNGSWRDRSIKEHIELLSDEVYADGEHEIVFKFLESAKNKRFTVEVSCEKYGTSYSGSAMVEVVPSAWESIVPIIIIIAFFGVGGIFGVCWLIRQKREDPPAQDVTAEML